LYGSSIEYVAPNCEIIKNSVTNKKSGYYWIRKECMVSPLRMFCDFENFDAYYYHGETKFQKDLGLKTISSVKDIKKKCAQIGL
jgi:hypothetical protein